MRVAKAIAAALFAALAYLSPLQTIDGLAEPRPMLTLEQAIQRVSQRYAGTVIDADVKNHSRKKNNRVVYEIRLVTERGNVIRVRLDGTSGEFLEVDGHGFLDALRP